MSRPADASTTWPATRPEGNGSNGPADADLPEAGRLDDLDDARPEGNGSNGPADASTNWTPTSSQTMGSSGRC